MLQEQTIKWSLSVLFFDTLCRCTILVVLNVLQSYGRVGENNKENFNFFETHEELVFTSKIS
jgi:hypothetical protein